eukprot:scaffold1856_cov56-Attheya_sp.AAC.4
MTNQQTTPLSINQQQQQAEEEEDDGVLFSCRCESAKSVTTLLSCLKQVAGENKRGAEGGRSAAGGSTSNKVQHATVFCGPTAITFHVHGRSRQSQSSVDMQVRSLHTVQNWLHLSHRLFGAGCATIYWITKKVLLDISDYMYVSN